MCLIFVPPIVLRAAVFCLRTDMYRLQWTTQEAGPSVRLEACERQDVAVPVMSCRSTVEGVSHQSTEPANVHIEKGDTH